MDVLLQSFLLVFASEMGDKTQLLALVLAIKFKRPWVIMWGILTATLLNHGLAAYLGVWVSGLIEARYLKGILSATFFAFSIWILVPDKEEELKNSNRWGAFWTTTVSFFFAEMGDKTQLATIALGARFMIPTSVIFGTTIGMLAADGLAVFLGESLVKKVPMKRIRWFTAALFFIFGLLILLAQPKLN